MFREKESLLHEGGERAPLIQNPIIWTQNHEFPMDPYHFGRAKKKQRFQWLLFITVAVFSLFLLAVLITAMARLGDQEISIPTGSETTPTTITYSLSTTATDFFMNSTITSADSLSNIKTSTFLPLLIPKEGSDAPQL